MEEAPSASRYGPLGAFSCPRGGECSRLVLPFHACLVLASSHQADGRPLRGRLMGVVPAPQAPPCPPLFLKTASRFLVAVLRILRVRSTPSSPSFVGACAQQKMFRRSYLAYFLHIFSQACPAGRQCSVGHSYASFATKQKQRGEENEGGRVTPLTHPTPNEGESKCLLQP